MYCTICTADKSLKKPFTKQKYAKTFNYTTLIDHIWMNKYINRIKSDEIKKLHPKLASYKFETANGVKKWILSAKKERLKPETLDMILRIFFNSPDINDYENKKQWLVHVLKYGIVMRIELLIIVKNWI